MSIVTCPTDVVHASAERVWQLVSDPTSLARWSGTRLRRGPSHPPPLRAGDVLRLGAGAGGVLSVDMDILATAAPTQLRVDVRLPFGILNHELVIITPLSPESSRVTFN